MASYDLEDLLEEVTHSMDTESFVVALCHFISRRGRPEKIRSDNKRRQGAT